MASWQIASQGCAALFAGIVATALALVIGDAAMAGWGWRVMFFLGLAVVPVGLVIRSHLPETAGEGEDPKAAGSARAVIGRLLRDHGRMLGLMFLVIAASTVSNAVGTNMPVYAGATLGLQRDRGDRRADRARPRLRRLSPPRGLARRQVRPAAGDDLAAGGDPRARRAGLRVATAVAGAGSRLRGDVPALGAVLDQRRRNHRRHPRGPAALGALDRLALVYALSVSIFGGSTNFLINWLVATTGDRLAPAYYLAAFSLVGTIAAMMLPETRDRTSTRRSPPPRAGESGTGRGGGGGAPARRPGRRGSRLEPRQLRGAGHLPAGPGRARVGLDDGRLGLATGRGAIALTPVPGLHPLAYETAFVGGWNHAVAFCLPEGACAGAGRRVVTECGPDAGAVRRQDRDGILFDLGLGLRAVDACVRTRDPALLALLRAGAGRPLFEPGNRRRGPPRRAEPAPGLRDAPRPDRGVHADPTARDAEPSRAPHPPSAGDSQGRPHPSRHRADPGRLRALRRPASSPSGKDAAGRAIPFDRARHETFQRLLDRWGDPALVAAKRAAEAGEGPSPVARSGRHLRGARRAAEVQAPYRRDPTA